MLKTTRIAGGLRNFDVAWYRDSILLLNPKRMGVLSPPYRFDEIVWHDLPDAFHIHYTDFENKSDVQFPLISRFTSDQEFLKPNINDGSFTKMAYSPPEEFHPIEVRSIDEFRTLLHSWDEILIWNHADNTFSKSFNVKERDERDFVAIAFSAYDPSRNRIFGCWRDDDGYDDFFLFEFDPEDETAKPKLLRVFENTYWIFGCFIEGIGLVVIGQSPEAEKRLMIFDGSKWLESEIEIIGVLCGAPYIFNCHSFLFVCTDDGILVKCNLLTGKTTQIHHFGCNPYHFAYSPFVNGICAITKGNELVVCLLESYTPTDYELCLKFPEFDFNEIPYLDLNYQTTVSEKGLEYLKEQLEKVKQRLPTLIDEFWQAANTRSESLHSLTHDYAKILSDHDGILWGQRELDTVQIQHELKSNVIGIGSRVKVACLGETEDSFEEILTFTVVDPNNRGPDIRAVDTLVGQAIVGKSAGDIVDVYDFQNRQSRHKILEVFP